MVSQRLKHLSTIKVPNVINSVLKGYLTKLSLFIMILMFFLTEVWSEIESKEQVKNSDEYVYNYLQKHEV